MDLEFVYPVQDNPQVTVPDVKVTDQPEVDNQPLPVYHPAHDGQPNYQVGPNHEENFMREVETLPPKRQRNPPVRFIEKEFYEADAVTADINEPSNISEAWKGEHSVYWKEETDCEYDSLLRNDTWDFVPLPKGKNVVGSRWVSKLKHNSDGSIERYKARLVAQGYSQSERVDYQEIFSPVVHYSTIRSLLAVANIYDWEIHQMDVKTTFLQGDLEEEIYMRQPDGYIDNDKPSHVCKLKKSIYGLKQAARCWNPAIDSHLKSNGYKNSGADPCVYISQLDKVMVELILLFLLFGWIF